jgi:hypothetical protein
MSARAEAQVLRIALIYAVLGGCNNVDLPHLRAALEVWRYCQDSVDYCFDGSIASTITDKIYAFLVTMPEGASLTQIFKLFHGHKKTEELQRAFDTLSTTGAVRREFRDTGKKKTEYWFAC